MRRSALLALCAALAGCQEYRFNPVGRCLVQPGQKRVQLEGFTTADILFLVDDSGSMDPMQQNLANNFGAFISRLAATQQDRVLRGLPALDFHIAVSTSSVFIAQRGSCAGSPLACTVPDPPASSTTPCSSQGSACVGVVDHYYDVGNGCTAGVAPGNGAAYPSGDFVARTGNPKVLHFTKNLNWAGGPTDPTIAPLVSQFAQNIQVGSCGSGEEQHFEGSRLALKKALRLDGLSQPADVPRSEWPHDGAKLVLVWVGNEDDCSNPKDPARALVYSGSPGNDMCSADQAKDPSQQQLYPVSEYASFFAGLGRAVGAAFIRPGDPGCNCTSGNCQGYSSGARFKALATAFRGLGSSVVEGSICDASFATTLRQIADLATPLELLQLPSQPAAGVVTRLRIVDATNRTVRLCDGPETTREWWFVTPEAGGGCGSASTPTGGSGTAPSTCVAIQKGGGCEASPGQAYVAEYMGRVPEEGCTVGASGAGQCAAALGGAAADWTCDGAAGQVGTCLCNDSP